MASFKNTVNYNYDKFNEDTTYIKDVKYWMEEELNTFILKEVFSPKFKKYFYKMHKDRYDYLIFNEDENKWMEVDKNYFRIFFSVTYGKMIFSIYNRAKEFIDDQNISDKKVIKTLESDFNYIRKWLNGTKSDKVDRFLPCAPEEAYEDFNQDRTIIPFKDGICYDFKIKGLREMTIKDRVTVFYSQSSDTYKNDSKDEEIRNILEDWLTDRNRKDDKEYVRQCKEKTQLLINTIYNALGGAQSRHVNLLTGATMNGKSQFLSLLDGMKNYTTPVSEKVFMKQKFSSTIETHLEALHKYRIGHFSEGTGELNEELVKRVTGGDSISVRTLQKTEYGMKATCTLFMTCNTPPKTSGEEAIVKRLRAYHFPNTYKIDPNFKKKIEEEISPHFLGFILRNFDKELKDEDNLEMIEALVQVQKHSDIIAQFIEDTGDYEYCEINNSPVFKVYDLMEDMRIWYSRNNKGAMLKKKDVMNCLRSGNGKFYKEVKESSLRGWKGIRKVIKSQNIIE